MPGRLIDAAEQYLDDHRLERRHLAGNSAGGFVAIELARRGRAATVCAFSSADFWSTGDGSQSRGNNKVPRIAAMSPTIWSAADVIAGAAFGEPEHRSARLT
jgi:pimeloyl-ACP methyl ester carboxylesterase